MSNNLTTVSSRKQFFLAGVASLASMAISIPVALSFAVSPAVDANPSTVKTADANYAQYAHAFTQGYLASATSEGAVAGTFCGVGGSGAGAAVTEQGAVAGAVSPVVWGESTHPTGGQSAGLTHVTPHKTHKAHQVMSQPEWVKQVSNSYNQYYSMVTNTAHTEVHNKNSNNVIGSNNTNSTHVAVEDSKNVSVMTKNENETTNMAIIDSFNKDSYNTNNDSFNTTNTTTNNTAVVNDSYNDESKTITHTTNTAIVKDSYNEKTMENVGNETTDNSGQNNSTNITDNEVDVEIEVETSPYPVLL